MTSEAVRIQDLPRDVRPIPGRERFFDERDDGERGDH
jgi:hypothetical protein